MMADFFGDPFKRTIQDASGKQFEVTSDRGFSTQRETVKLENGSTVNVYRGSERDDEALQVLREKQYEANSLIRLQEEQAVIAEEAKRAYPDGRGYTEAVQAHVLDRTNQILDGAQSAQQKTRLIELMDNFVGSALKQANKVENDLTKQSYLNAHFESMNDIEQEAARNPGSLPGLRQEAADRIMDMGETLGWDREDIVDAIKETDRELVTTSIHSLAEQDPEEIYTRLDEGFYSDVFSEKEIDGFKRFADEILMREEEFETLPPIQEVLNSARKRAMNDEDVDQARSQGEITGVEKVIVEDLKQIEQQRLADPVYRNNKELLMDAQPGGSDAEDKSYAQQRLQAAYDDGSLNEQTVQSIHLEVARRVETRINKELRSLPKLPNSDPVLPNTLEEIKAVGIENLKVNLVNAYKSGSITLEEAKQARKALMNAAGAIE